MSKLVVTIKNNASSSEFKMRSALSKTVPKFKTFLLFELGPAVSSLYVLTEKSEENFYKANRRILKWGLDLEGSTTLNCPRVHSRISLVFDTKISHRIRYKVYICLSDLIIPKISLFAFFIFRPFKAVGMLIPLEFFYSIFTWYYHHSTPISVT